MLTLEKLEVTLPPQKVDFYFSSETAGEVTKIHYRGDFTWNLMRHDDKKQYRKYVSEQSKGIEPIDEEDMKY